MDLDERYARMLDAMDEAADADVRCDWVRCRRLAEEALAILDRSGQGHTAVGRALANAVAALEQEPASSPIYMDDSAFAFAEPARLS